MTASLLRAAADYLDALEANMLRNDADMQMDKCEPPSEWNTRLRTAADQMEGMVLVPVEPTEAMLTADDTWACALAEDAAGVWKAMIAASQSREG